MESMLHRMEGKDCRELGQQDAFGKALQQLPIELLLEIVGHLTFDDEEPRSRQATILLQTLMNVSRRLRAIVRPIFWSEVHLASKHDWNGLKGLLRKNRFTSKPAILPANLITCLSLELAKIGEGFGGIEPIDIAEMAQALPSVTRVKLGTNEQVRLNGPHSAFGQAVTYRAALAGFTDRLTHLAFINTTADDPACSAALATKCNELTHLLVDNVSACQNFEVPTHRQLPVLQSFRLRNAPSLLSIEPFKHLLAQARLHTLQLRNVCFDPQMLFDLLAHAKDTLRHLEIGTSSPPSVIDRNMLLCEHRAGTLSLQTGFYFPLTVLQESRRVGNEAASLAPAVAELSLGGMLCVSPDLFEILLERDQPLHTLRLFNAWPFRPSRPDDHPEAAQKKALLLQNPSGIAPEDVLEAFEDGLLLQRLELLGMGEEWNLETSEAAKQVAEECRRRKIVFVCR